MKKAIIELDNVWKTYEMGVFFGVNINLLSMYGNATTYDVLTSSLYFGVPWAVYKAQSFDKHEGIESGLAAYVGAITGHTLAQLMVRGIPP